MSFSQRHGYKPIKKVMQIDSVDQELRNGLWNALHIFYWSTGKSGYLDSPHNESLHDCFYWLWLDYFKERIDTIPRYLSEVIDKMRQYFFSCGWNEVYDIIEFIAQNYKIVNANKKFMDYCNSILEREVSGYRFIGGEITPITSPEEIAEIEEALQGEKALGPVVIHLKSALDLFSDRKSPDYRNSIKESISAVEAMCRLIVGSEATLGKALSEIRRRGELHLHGALEDAFDKLYGYTSDEGGIRHSLLEESDLDCEDAKFMLVSCSAFINYLKVKVSKAGIDLEAR